MKKISILIILIFPVCFSAQFTVKLPKIYSYEQVNDSQRVSQEISIYDYFVFVAALSDDNAFQDEFDNKDQKNDSIKKLLPQKNANNIAYFYTELYDKFATEGKKIVPKNKSGAWLPVTGITFQQALAYCNWKSLKAPTEKISSGEKKTAAKYTFRLLKLREYDSLITQDMRLSKDWRKEAYAIIKTKTGRNEKNCACINFNFTPLCVSDSNVIKTRKNGLLDNDVMFPDNFGLQNLQGNASEMTMEFGKAFGGSYKHEFKDCVPGTFNAYTKPEEWLGFRVIATLKKDQ